MSNHWSPKDKAVAKTAAERARRRAEQEAITLHANYKINGIDDLWALELTIRQWRKERQYCFTMNFQTANEQLSEWLSRGWLLESELNSLSPEHLNAIKANA